LLLLLCLSCLLRALPLLRLSCALCALSHSRLLRQLLLLAAGVLRRMPDLALHLLLPLQQHCQCCRLLYLGSNDDNQDSMVCVDACLATRQPRSAAHHDNTWANTESAQPVHPVSVPRMAQLLDLLLQHLHLFVQ
jgi:hypothetical protein